MKIGYPCVNRTVGCSAARTFRLRSFSEERLVETVEGNLACLHEILKYNVAHGLLFFRVSSDTVPFASHPVCNVPWQSRFAQSFRALGRFIEKEGLRISMHPDQFVLLNAGDERIVEQSTRELIYHGEMLDLMGLGPEAKIQIHVGAAYGDKEKSMDRFMRVYETLDKNLKLRLVIENDHRIYDAADCLRISENIGIPVLTDTFHHSLNRRGEPLGEILRRCAATWKRKDGPPMVDYSSQEPGSRPGTHARSIDLKDFKDFIRTVNELNLEMDVMLEVKDKEKSALRALKVLNA